MEMRFSLDLHCCHLLLESGFFSRDLASSPPIVVIVPPCDQSCQPGIQVSMISPPSNKPFARVYIYIVRRKINAPDRSNRKDRYAQDKTCEPWGRTRVGTWMRTTYEQTPTISR